MNLEPIPLGSLAGFDGELRYYGADGERMLQLQRPGDQLEYIYRPLGKKGEWVIMSCSGAWFGSTQPPAHIVKAFVNLITLIP